jgi:hypothetical protein
MGNARSPQEGYDWEAAEDLTALSEGDLRRVLADLSEEERAVTLRLEVLRGRMNLVRAELVGRGLVDLAPEDLARVLLGEAWEGRP